MSDGLQMACGSTARVVVDGYRDHDATIRAFNFGLQGGTLSAHG